MVCGVTDGLEVHHKNPADKEFVVAKMLSWCWERIVLELDKCELRCGAHHHDEHSIRHGTHQMYRSGCRCEACIEEPRRWNREYKRVRRLTDLGYGRRREGAG